MTLALRSLLVAALACIAGAPRGVLAQTPSHPAGVSLREAIAAALLNNPDVLLARAAVDSARAERRIAGALPNPTLATVPNSPFQYSASIPLDITPARLYRGRAATLGVDASNADGRDARRQITFAVVRSFYDLLLAEKRRDLSSERRDAVHQVLVADSTRVRSGEIASHNLARSEVEMARADADFARADVDVQSARFTLEALMGERRADTSFAVNGSLDYRGLQPKSDSLVAIALASRPDLQASLARVDQSHAAKQLTSSLLIPVPVLSYVRQYTAPFDNGRFSAIGLSFELPSLDLFGGQRSRASAAEESARLARRRIEIQVERDVASALAEFRIQGALVERYRGGLLDHVEESVKAARYAYARGATSLLDVLDAVRSQQDVQVDYFTALHDYWLSVYGLNAAVGVDLFGLDG
ncbi:MAG: TolC family protein [Gemmatimonadaceae bacterium]